LWRSAQGVVEDEFLSGIAHVYTGIASGIVACIVGVRTK